eukprot:INCI12295.1.p1 GENE.INCI12295.1~~INCI12295.1.p1  ORF type:complete len:496 (+),score=74.94 INCI12295.1:158-1645(+)
MSEITPAPEDPKDPEDQKQQLDEGEEDEEEEPSATATPASPMSRKTKISEAHAALVVEDGQRKRTRVGSTSEEPSGAQSTATVPETDSKEESAVSAPAPAPAPSFDASATGSATGAAATPASDNNKDILHPCLRLADPSFVMIPVPKVFNTPSTVNQGGFQIECAVLKSASGHIIGRGGAKIKAIRETSGAGVKMLDHVGMATFRSIVITGTFEQCRAAYGAIADQVNDTSIAANVPAVEGQHTLTLLVPNNKVGGLIGQKGAVINEIRAKSGANVALAKPDDMHVGSMDRVVTITGAFTQVQIAWALVSETLASIVPTKENTPIQRAADHGGFMSGQIQHVGAARGATTMTHNVILTNDQAGIIIGRGGSHINEMRRYVGCDIRIDASNRGDASMRNVRITGTPQQIQLAQTMILNKIQSSVVSQHQNGHALQGQRHSVPSGQDRQYQPQAGHPSHLNAYGHAQGSSYGHVGQPLGQGQFQHQHPHHHPHQGGY